MTKTCGKCGHAALDDRAQFCNRCGASVPAEKKHAFPVCPACGTVVSDELAQFCNRCGSKILPLPVICSSCGTQAVDSQSRFCTRCGTTFDQVPVPRTMACPSCGAPDPQGQSLFCNRCGAPFNRQSSPGENPRNQTPVIVTQRRPATPVLPVMVPDSDWEPWNDEPHIPAPPAGSGPVTGKPAADPQTAVQPKRYAHIPLVAEDMKKENDAPVRLQVPDSPQTQKKRSTPQKKGVLGLLKK